jgi:hypothetical protein
MELYDSINTLHTRGETAGKLDLDMNSIYESDNSGKALHLHMALITPRIDIIRQTQIGKPAMLEVNEEWMKFGRRLCLQFFRIKITVKNILARG